MPFLVAEMSFLLISDSNFVSDHYGVDNAEMATVGSVLSGTIQVWPIQNFHSIYLFDQSLKSCCKSLITLLAVEFNFQFSIKLGCRVTRFFCEQM